MYKELHLSITTVCNMKCPYCTYGSNWRVQKHSTLNEIEECLPWLNGIPSICITGGEPTTHPLLWDIVQLVRERLHGITLEMETNAVSYPSFKRVLPMFDSIHATLYGEEAWPGCPSNADQVELLNKDYPSLVILKAKHDTIHMNRGSNTCGRQLRAHWSHGLVYGCCTAPGYKSAIGIKLGPDWHDILSQTALPCSECPFGQP